MSAAHHDVVLVVPPFATAWSPALGPSLLKAACSARGVSAWVLYANVDLAARVGFERYERVALGPFSQLTGEAVFRAAAFPAQRAELDSRRLVSEQASRSDLPVWAEALVAAQERTNGAALADAALACLAEVEPCLDGIVDRLLAGRPRIVGFSSVFQQNLASVALARRLKSRNPEVVTVLGGANATSPMGAALAELSGDFDLVVSGEADVAFPELCQRLLESGQLPEERVVHCPPVHDLGAVPAPDYDDYFEQVTPLVSSGKLPAGIPEWLSVETSRGCAWGEHRPCLFCGLNGPELSHRHKPPARVLDELRLLVDRHRVRRFELADNALPRVMQDELLPALAVSGDALELYCEVRPDLPPEVLDRLVLAGTVAVQPGIESLSTRVLRLLDKGTTSLRNLVLLRDSASRGLGLGWNLLVRVPGETRADYEATLRLLPFIEHLQPPVGCGPIRVDRFSPLFDRRDERGLGSVRPFPAYNRVYPPGTAVERIALHFLADDVHSGLYEDPELLSRLTAAVRAWMRGWFDPSTRPRLAAIPLGRGLELVEDTRACAVERFLILAPETADLLARLDRPTPPDRVPEADHESTALLLDRRLAVEHEGRLVSLVTRPALGHALRRQRRRLQDVAGSPMLESSA